MDKELSMEEVAAFLQEAEQLLREDDFNIFTTRSPEKLLQYRDAAVARADLAQEEKGKVAAQSEMARHYG